MRVPVKDGEDRDHGCGDSQRRSRLKHHGRTQQNGRCCDAVFNSGQSGAHQTLAFLTVVIGGPRH